MTKEDKQLLLVDLCGRVPYHPKGYVVNARTGAMCDEWLTCATFPMFVNITNNCRLYLRPMSSMTEEEKEEFDGFCVIDEFAWKGNSEIGYKNQAIIMSDAIEWLLKKHFDFLDLIPKGLAIEVSEENYG